MMHLPIGRAAALAVTCVLTVFVVSPSGALVESALELRILREQARCGECESVHFVTPHSDSDLHFARSAADLSIPRDLVAEVRTFEFADEGGQRWEARIDLTAIGWEVLKRFRRRLGSGGTPLMISAGGRPVDVVLAGQLAFEVRVGAFSSLQDLRDAFPSAVVSGDRRTREVDPGSEVLFESLKRRVEEDERLKGKVDALVDALIAGDSQTVEALLKEIPLDPSD